MRSLSNVVWPAALYDPSGQRRKAEPGNHKETKRGRTMVIDKGLGKHAFMDLMETAGDYIDCVKFGFGTSALYNPEVLLYKIMVAKRYGIMVMPGGTLLETAVQQDVVPEFFNTIASLGFNGIEVSDGTIELSRRRRTSLIKQGIEHGFRVVTEYGKKLSGSLLDASLLAVTAESDWEAGAELVTVEARESGINVGIFDENGNCRDDVLDAVLKFIPDPGRLMWETPQKRQQVLLLRKLGSNAHLGNIAPSDVLSLESMRRGLRTDTFDFGQQPKQALASFYMI